MVSSGDEAESTSRVHSNRWRAALLSLLLAAMAPWYFYSPDDVFIHLRFADNVLNRTEWAFNPGEPVAGNTSPVWVALLSALMVCGIPALYAAKALGTAAAALLVLSVEKACRLAGASAPLALLTAAAVAGSHWLRLWSAAGMETPLPPLLLVGAIVFAWQAPPRPATAGFLLGLASWSRPDAVPAALAAGILMASALHRGRRKTLVATGAAVGLSWPLFSRVFLGRWFPLTVTAKSGWEAAWERLVPALTRTTWVAASEMLALVTLAVVVLAADRRVRSRWRYWSLPLVAALTYPIGYALNHMSGGVEATGRYLVPWFVLVAVSASMMVVPLWQVRRWRRLVIAAAVLTLGQSATLTAIHRPAVLRYHDYHQRSLLAAAEWLRKNAGPNDAVAAGDIGVLGFVGQIRVLDLAGIINPEAQTWRENGATFEALQDIKPRYFINPAWPMSFDLERLDPFTVTKVFVHQHASYRWTLHPGRFEVALRVMDWQRESPTRNATVSARPVALFGLDRAENLRIRHFYVPSIRAHCLDVLS